MTAPGNSARHAIRRMDLTRTGPNAYLKVRAPAARAQRLLFEDEGFVAFKVNYGLKKAERDRAKKEKKEAKARERQAAAVHGADGHPGDGAGADGLPEEDETDADAAGTTPHTEA